LSLADRRRELAARAELTSDDLALLDTGGLAAADAARMIENVVGIYALPLGVALNFQVNQRDYLVPMAVEEPSVVAAASYAARMVRAGGGFSATADLPVMIAQIELRDVGDPAAARARIEAARAEILALADSCQPSWSASVVARAIWKCDT
jgi:hydroxymethylglutaryl-CoA reductase